MTMCADVFSGTFPYISIVVRRKARSSVHFRRFCDSETRGAVATVLVEAGGQPMFARSETRSEPLRMFVCAVALSGSVACSGVIGDASGTGSPSTGGQQVLGLFGHARVEIDSLTGAPRAAPCTDGSTRGASRESVRRLTREELRATLADSLPTAATQVDADIDEVPNDGDYLDGFQPFDTAAQASQWVPPWSPTKSGKPLRKRVDSFGIG